MSDVINTEKLRVLFQEHMEEASAMLSKKEAAISVIDAVDAKLKENQALRDAVEGIPEMSSFLRSYLCGEFTEVSERSVAAVLGSFLYLAKEDDAIHDGSPVIGYLDDLGIIAQAQDIAKADLEKFLHWRAS